ncbi:helix-turn-helix domain-containing protein [Kitasatospora sp. NPDC004615]|uniref:AraC-like ligand-binding domain-containing protein n=1 Tax=Kitasatospora sp. NPDC004615 TaxID=3364017 RepID=UPI00368983F6
MSAELPTGPLSAAEHAEMWHAAVATAYVPMAVEFLEEEPAPGTISSHRLGPMRILQVRAAPQTATRTRRMIERDESAALILTLQQSGTALKEQDGREALIRPGSFSITDASRTFRKRVAEDFVFTSFHFPRAALDVEERHLRALTATAFAPEGSAALAATYLAGMAREAATLDEAVGRRAAATALDLLSLVVEDRCGRERPPQAHAAASLARIKDHILRNLGDPDLSPSGIAEANHVSLRFLHKLFQQEGATVGAWIRAQRLERCGRDLRRPMAEQAGVAGIARRWGFVNSSHFSRAFRATYGMAPREWQLLGRSEG